MCGCVVGCLLGRSTRRDDADSPGVESIDVRHAINLRDRDFRMGLFSSSYFRRKDIHQLIGQMNDSERLHRRLGPVALMGLGIGATIGTGLYVQTGRIANEYAGPSLILSFLLAAVGCGFAALCYSELASMVPVAGSAYTYAYATLGELLAWIIGWDLILEYAIGSSFVAAGWSNYLDRLVAECLPLPDRPATHVGPWDFNVAKGEFFLKYVTLADGSTVLAWFNLPAVFITAAITVVLVIGVKESAGFNAAMVLLNVAVILTIVGIGAAYVDPRNWRPFLHEEKKWWGVAEGAGRIFFAYIGFDSISTHAEEARKPQRDLAIGILGALTVCTILYVAVAAVLTGMVPYRQIDIQAPLTAALQGKGPDIRRRPDHAGHPRGHDQFAAGRQFEPAAHPPGHGPRRASSPRDFRGDPSAVQDAVEVDHPGRRGRRGRGRAGTTGIPGRSGQHRHLVRVRGRLGGCLDPADYRSRRASRPFRAPWVPFVSTMGILVNGGMMFSLGPENWIRLLVWLVLGLLIYFGYSRHHSALRSKPLGTVQEG